MSHVAKLTIQPEKPDYRLVANQVREALDGLVIGKHASGAEITFRDMHAGQSLGADNQMTQVAKEGCKACCDLVKNSYVAVKLAHPSLDTSYLNAVVLGHLTNAVKYYTGEPASPKLKHAFNAMDATVNKMLEGYGIRPVRQIGG